VPDAIANEMASDLDADLAEAASDDVAPEEVLGDGVFDAPSFARSWASARGVIPVHTILARRTDGQRITAGVLAVLAVLGVGLLTLVVIHPTARAVMVRRAVVLGPRVGNQAPPFARPDFVVGHPGSVGAPAGTLIVGLLVIAALAGSAWYLWRRA
jgi:hypothetical protein